MTHAVQPKHLLPDMGTVKVHALGCRLNAYEAEVIRQKAEATGLDDMVVINSCAVTNEAVRQTRQLARKLKRENPDTHLVMTGCAVETDSEALSQIPEIDALLGNRDKLEIGAYQRLVTALKNKSEPSDEAHVTEPVIFKRAIEGHVPDDHFELNTFQDRHRATVQIQGGCDHRCTFCVIPFGRGPSRSRPVHRVVAAIQKLVDSGYQEVTLTGVDITDYGLDLDEAVNLGGLVRAVLDGCPELPRLRLSSLDPAEIDDDLMCALKSEMRLMPHIHLSMQAGADLILKRMKRRHRAAHINHLCETLLCARPEFSFGADIIAGFPTETEAHFQESLSLVRRWRMTHLHVFPYSARKGTPAARMPQVEGPLIKARAKALRALGATQLQRRLSDEVGGIVPVLFETDARGRTPHNFIVMNDGPKTKGKIDLMHLVSSDHGQLYGHPVQSPLQRPLHNG